MICIRTSKSIVLLTIVALVIEYSNQYEVKNVIKEEDNIAKLSDQLTPGKNNLINKLKSQPSKMNTNKEFVFGEDDDDDDDDEDDKLDKEIPTSDLNMINNKPFETEMHNKESSEEVDEEEEDDDLSLLKRNQRVDTKHPSHEKNLPALLKFNKMADLQKKLLELSDNRHNFDYDILIDDEFLESNKNKLKTNKKANSIESFEDDDDDDLEDEENDSLTVEELITQLESKLKTGHTKSKFFLPTLKVKEQQFMEGVYNKNKAKEQNSFFNPENEMELEKEMSNSEVNDVLKEENAKSNQTGSQNIISNPSYKMRNENTHESVDSKFEFIKRQNDYLFLFVVAGCTLAGVVALLAASVCWYTVAKSRRASKIDNEYENSKNSLFGNLHQANCSSASGSIKSKSSNSSGDKKLALSAQMYHFQHQKEQIIAMEKANSESKPDDSDNSDDETQEGDYTVYECPGLAPTGEMEVKNPLFKEDYNGSSNSLSNKSQAPPPSYSTLALNTSEINETLKQSEIKPAETTTTTEKTKL